METLFVKSLIPWILPPGLNIALMLFGMVCKRWWRRTGLTCFAVGLLTLYAFSTYEGSTVLRRWVEIYPALTPGELNETGAQAIVVMGGGRYPEGPEYGGETVSLATLARLRYAALIHRTTKLPVLVTGGRVYGETKAEADLMRQVATEELALPIRWVESSARNSAENALNSAPMLRQAGVERILLVTNAIHMRRSVAVFRSQGFEVVPAPTLVETSGDGTYGWLRGLSPSVSALEESTACLHEMIGLLWYRIRYGI
jgi:uncharacterized SAM-binding protein YcdF (DUF218 family)